MKQPYFSIHELTDRLGNFHLGPISLELDKNEYFVLLGPTGCGKSSLLRWIAGFFGNRKNTIFLNGIDIGALSPRKRNIGFVTQTCDLFPHLTARENIEFGLAYERLSKDEKEKRIDRFIDLFDLTRQADQKVTTLSGGESKRTAMARSLIVEPRMLLLDEPLGMLDHNARKSILKILKRIHDEFQITTIHVTHDRHEAWKVGQTCAVMHQGKILQTSSVSELFREPRTLFVAEFLGGANIFQADFKKPHAIFDWTQLKLDHEILNSKGWVLIRPELIQIHHEKVNGHISGIVTDIHDLGEYVEVNVKTPQSTELMVYADVKTIDKTHIGQTVFLSWPDNAIHPIYYGD